MKSNNRYKFLALKRIVLVTVIATGPAFSTLAQAQSSFDVCVKHEESKTIEAQRKARAEFQKMFDQVVSLCGSPWLDRFLLKINRFSNAAAGTFAFKFSQDEEEKRKRLMGQKLDALERQSGESLDPRVRAQFDTQLGFYERIPTFDIQDRWQHTGLSTTTADILNFAGLDQALDVCYPIVPKSKSRLQWLASLAQNRWMKYHFRMALAFDDVAPTALGVATGGVATYFFGGAAVKGVQATRAALVARGVKPTTLKYAKYAGLSALGGGAYYGWHSIQQNQTILEKVETSLENQVIEQIESPEAAVENAKMDCFERVSDNKKSGREPHADPLTQLTCDYFVQMANQTLMSLETIPQYRCQANYLQKSQTIENALSSYTSLLDSTK